MGMVLLLTTDQTRGLSFLEAREILRRLTCIKEYTIAYHKDPEDNWS